MKDTGKGVMRNSTSSSAGVDSQSLARIWLFTKEEIDEQSPSRKDGIGFEVESNLRKLYCSFLQDLGKKLKMYDPSNFEFYSVEVPIATSILLCHRFFMRQSHAKNDWRIIATAAMFLACKSEETPCPSSTIVIVAYELKYNSDPSASQRIRQRDFYSKHKRLLFLGENLLLSTIAFDLNYEIPHKPLVAIMRMMKIPLGELAKAAWNFVNDSMNTTLCLRYRAHCIAVSSIYFASKLHKGELLTEKGKAWWLDFGLSSAQLEDIIQEVVKVLELDKKPSQPSRKLSEHTSIKQSSHSTQSCVLSSSETKSGGLVPTVASDSTSLAPRDYSSAGKRKQWQGSDCSSGISRVADDGGCDEKKRRQV